MSRKLDLPLSVAIALALHAVLLATGYGGLFPADAAPMLSRGETAIFVDFARPMEVVKPIELEKEDEPDEIERPEEKPLEIPEIDPEEIVIPRMDDDEIPEPEEPPAEPPKVIESSPPPLAGADVPEGVRDAKLLGSAKPEYPEESQLKGEEGRVVVLVEVLPNGRAGTVVMKRSSGYWRLDKSAVSFLRRARYRVATDRKGRKITQVRTIPVRFELKHYEKVKEPDPEPGPDL